MKEETMQVMEHFCSIVESRNLSSKAHCHRVRLFTELLIENIRKFWPMYHLTAKDCKMISYASVLHDVGKIAISDAIVCKPNRLTEDESKILENHTRKGQKIFSSYLEKMQPGTSDYRFYQYCEEICLYHHERYDGNGYPFGLSGENIPISAQIVGLADSYDMLLSERIYKFACPKEEAFEMILDGDCGAFSPVLTKVFQMLRMELEELADEPM